ncbi:hypothetical protein SLEP1_g44023 [Rubroshorea leprosula]|uniref:Uncharacterized protein n=1 Tax=Rubroshorea leprosula TaxID=152421 RepID=A0AAV5LEW6_9ROSI|nr:hypothetical protein SLEP1_g44023 [Rubroshorea leprosula]
MASQDQGFRAGEAKGRTEEKTNQTMDSMREKAEAAKNKTYESAEAAKNKTTETVEAAKDKSYETAEAAKEKAHEGKEKTGGVLQKTGEQMRNMAHGAADAVKHTFGMANEDKDKHNTTSCRRDSN